jgi:hypothetical protein
MGRLERMEHGNGIKVREDSSNGIEILLSVVCLSATEKVVYYESRKRDLMIRLLNEGHCDERLKGRVEESTCLTYSGLSDKT